MLFYHETQNEQINLDKEPLLAEHKSKQKTTNKSTSKDEAARGDYQLLNDITLMIDEFYMSKVSIMSETSQIDTSCINESLGDFNNNINNFSYNYETEISQNLLGIFVVSFDTKLGNIIEWQIPNDLNLENIEFKAMASGFHLVQNDFVYFCKDDMYGLAAFENLKIDNSQERNARMKSVGLMAKSFKFLKKYVIFLKNQVKYQLEQPGHYDNLIYLWNKKRVMNISEMNEISLPASASTSQTNDLQQQAVALNDHSINHYVNKIFNKRLLIYKQLSSISYCPYTKFSLYFGPSVFTLWKYVLLNKRIIFYAAPPISDLCSRVLCASQMLLTNVEPTNPTIPKLKPFFFVNVMDIEQLQQQPFYLACTTERIFQSKEYIYDLFVCDTQMQAVLAECQKNLLKVNSADKKRYDLLLKKISNLPLVKSPNMFTQVDNADDDESMFFDFFSEQNDKIFGVLNELHNMSKTSNENKPVSLTNDCIKKMGLDTTDDRDFLNELIKFYDYNLII